MDENHPVGFEVTMAGIPGKGGVKGRSGPPGNQNAFKHGIQARARPFRSGASKLSILREKESGNRIRGIDGHHSGMRKSALLESVATSIETRRQVDCRSSSDETRARLTSAAADWTCEPLNDNAIRKPDTEAHGKCTHGKCSVERPVRRC